MDGVVSVRDQIDEMLGVMRSEPAADEPPPADDKVEPEPVAEPAGGEQDVKEPQGDQEPEPEPELEPEPEPEPKVDELAATKAEVMELKRKLEEFMTKPKTEEPPPKESPDLQFVDEDTDIDDVVRDPGAFNKLLNAVHKKSRETMFSDLMRDLPDVVRQNIEVIEAVKSKTNAFYEKNPDLKPFMKAVATVYDEVSKTHSDWDIDKVLNEVGIESKKRLNLTDRSSGDRRPASKPTLPPGSKGAKRSIEKPKVDPLVEEIEKMNAVR